VAGPDATVRIYGSVAPRDVAALDWDSFTWPEAVTWFAR
jgi:hypothetical protein